MTKQKSIFVSLTIAAVSVMWIAGIACAQATAEKEKAAVTTAPATTTAPSTVVATIGDRKLTYGDLQDIKKFFGATTVPDKEIINSWKRFTAQGLMAQESGMEKDPVTKVPFQMMLDKMKGDLYVRYRMMSIKVSDADVKKYYDEHKNEPEFHKGQFITARLIATAKEDEIKNIKKQLTEGADFNKLVEANAAETNKITGMSTPDIKGVATEQLAGSLGQPIASTMTVVQLNEVIGPRQLMGNKGWILFKVTERKLGDLIPFDQVKERINNQVLRQKQMDLYRTIMDEVQKKSGVTPEPPMMPMQRGPQGPKGPKGPKKP